MAIHVVAVASPAHQRMYKHLFGNTSIICEYRKFNPMCGQLLLLPTLPYTPGDVHVSATRLTVQVHTSYALAFNIAAVA